MTYLATLPSLLCGLVLCGTDLAHRRVPRATVALGFLIQLLVLVGVGLWTARPWLFVLCAAYGLAAMGMQLGLALLRPGSLGFGDVTVALVIGQALGLFGVRAFVLWWLLMGVLGLIWIWAWNRYARPEPQDQSQTTPVTVPFVPVMVCAGLFAAVLG